MMYILSYSNVKDGIVLSNLFDDIININILGIKINLLQLLDILSSYTNIMLLMLIVVLISIPIAFVRIVNDKKGKHSNRGENPQYSLYIELEGSYTREEYMRKSRLSSSERRFFISLILLGTLATLAYITALFVLLTFKP